MLNLRWIRHYQLLVIAAIALLVVGVGGALFWVNKYGISGEWAQRVTAELARRDIHAEFQSVRFSPLRGIIAREVTVYSDASRQTIRARIPRVRFEVDRAKALRGEFVVRKVILHEADLNLPVSTNLEEVINIQDLSGEAIIDRADRLILEDASGLLGGMKFNLRVEMDAFDTSRYARSGSGAATERRDDFLAGLFEELSLWSYPDGAPPSFDVTLTGSMDRPETIRTSFAVNAPELSRRDYTVKDLLFTGELHGRTLTVDQLEFSDHFGTLLLYAEYDLEDKEGRYELVKSTIQIADLLQKALDNHSMADVDSERPPTITGEGRFHFGEDGFHIGAIGKLELPAFTFKEFPFEKLSTSFSWQEGDIYLRDLRVQHARGVLTGQILMKGDSIQYEAESTFPVSVYDPLVRPGSGLSKILANTTFNERTTFQIKAEGTLRRTNLRDGASSGSATIVDLHYNGVPLERIAGNFSINQLESIFTEIEADFDYSDYPLREKRSGPARARIFAERVASDNKKGLIYVSNLRGTAWPGPVLRLFAPPAAEHIETAYGFHQPPRLSATGVIDGRRPPVRTDITTRMFAPGITDYKFLGKNLELVDTSASIRSRYYRQDITDLETNTFSGNGGGHITVRHPPGRPSDYEGGLKFNELSLGQIADTYEFGEDIEKGSLTGRIDFSGRSGNGRSLNGTGVLALRNGELFFVPVFGPLSGPIAGVIGNKNFSHEEARNASGTFAIKNGVAFTRDFLTSTPSTVFTGEGRIDLVEKKIDMTMRMNARGLLGLVTLPLRPFNGLFQFRGTGTLKEPVWRAAPFTQPARGKDDPIFRQPPRAQVVPEP